MVVRIGDGLRRLVGSIDRNLGGSDESSVDVAPLVGDGLVARSGGWDELHRYLVLLTCY